MRGSFGLTIERVQIKPSLGYSLPQPNVCAISIVVSEHASKGLRPLDTDLVPYPGLLSGQLAKGAYTSYTHDGGVIGNGKTLLTSRPDRSIRVGDGLNMSIEPNRVGYVDTRDLPWLWDVLAGS
jgi:hypothetical protein